MAGFHGFFSVGWSLNPDEFGVLTKRRLQLLDFGRSQIQNDAQLPTFAQSGPRPRMDCSEPSLPRAGRHLLSQGDHLICKRRQLVHLGPKRLVRAFQLANAGSVFSNVLSHLGISCRHRCRLLYCHINGLVKASDLKPEQTKSEKSQHTPSDTRQQFDLYQFLKVAGRELLQGSFQNPQS